MNISHYGIVGPGNFSNEKYIRVKKKKVLDILLRKKSILCFHELFANTSHLTNNIPIPIRKFWNSRTIPIPMRKEVGSANLFLILFAGKNYYSLITAEKGRKWLKLTAVSVPR